MFPFFYPLPLNWKRLENPLREFSPDGRIGRQTDLEVLNFLLEVR